MASYWLAIFNYVGEIKEEGKSFECGMISLRVGTKLL
jgi:hypothetical protein